MGSMAAPEFAHLLADKLASASPVISAHAYM